MVTQTTTVTDEKGYTMNWTKEETTSLRDKGFLVYGQFASHSEINGISLMKQRTTDIMVGVEGRDRDSDGDWGWSRNWHTYKSLDEALDGKELKIRLTRILK